MLKTMTALKHLLAQVSDAELEDLFGECLAGLVPGPLPEDTGWYSGAEIRELLATRAERRQARVDAEAQLAGAAA